MSGNKIRLRVSSPRPSVSPSAVLLVVTASTLLSWLLPLLLGKYADTSFPRINCDDILYKMLTVDRLQGLSKGEKFALEHANDNGPSNAVLRDALHGKPASEKDKRLKPASEKDKRLPLCPAVSPHLLGLQLEAEKRASPEDWSLESTVTWANKRGIRPGGFWDPPDCRARYAVSLCKHLASSLKM